MDNSTLAVTGLFGAFVFAGWVWLLFRRPTGPRIVRFARGFLAEHPGATAGELRDALRRHFLGGVTPIDWTDTSDRQEGEALATVVEGVRDRWFPIDRATVAGKIEAAIAITSAEATGGRPEVASPAHTPHPEGGGDSL